VTVLPCTTAECEDGPIGTLAVEAASGITAVIGADEALVPTTAT
jgi:hypothetical protein